MSFIESYLPFGFAENKDESDARIFIEWLEDSIEFPDLNSANSDLNGGQWELLEKIEIQDYAIVPLEEDEIEENWSNIIFKESYVKVAEKNLDQIKAFEKPTKNEFINKVADKEKQHEEQGQDELELFEIQKGQRKTNMRSRHLRKMHRLKTTNYYVHGILRLATSHTSHSNLKYLGYQKETLTSNKMEAIKFSAKFNAKKFNQKESSGIKNQKIDFSEYSVKDAITKTIK